MGTALVALPRGMMPAIDRPSQPGGRHALHQAEEIQAHLQAQDVAINTLLDKIERLEASIVLPNT